MNIIEKIETNYYNKIEVECPRLENYVDHIFVKDGVEIHTGSYLKYLEYIAKEKVENAIFDRVYDMKSYRQDKKNYQDSIDTKKEEFKTDLFKEFGVENNPKAVELYGKLKDNFNLSDLDFVETFKNFVSLIK